jgi:hypothetical protein
MALSVKFGLRRLHAGALGELGFLRAQASRGERGREQLAAARDLAREVGVPGCETIARCRLALLEGGDATDALAAFAEHESRLSTVERRDAVLLLWKATGDRAHLQEARRLLDEALAQAPEEHREALCRNLLRNSEVLAAWRAEFGEEGDAQHGSSPTESPTRAG